MELAPRRLFPLYSQAVQNSLLLLLPPCPDGLVVNIRIKGTPWETIIKTCFVHMVWVAMVCVRVVCKHRGGHRVSGYITPYPVCLRQALSLTLKISCWPANFSDPPVSAHPKPLTHRYCGLCLPGHTQLYLVSYVCVLRI